MDLEVAFAYILFIKNQNLILPNQLIIFHDFVITGRIDRDRKYNKIKSHDYFFNNFDISSIAVTLLWTLDCVRIWNFEFKKLAIAFSCPKS